MNNASSADSIRYSGQWVLSASAADRWGCFAEINSPTAGEELFTAGKAVGVLTSVTISPRLGPIGLGYVRRGQESPGTMLDVGGRVAEVVGLPMT